MLSELVHEFFNLDKEIKRLEDRKREIKQLLVNRLKDQINQTILVRYKKIIYKVSLKEIERSILDIIELKQKYKSIYDQFLKVTKSMMLKVEIQNVEGEDGVEFLSDSQEGGE